MTNTNRITKKMIVDFMVANPTASAEEILYHNFDGTTLETERYKRTQKELPLHERDENFNIASAVEDIMNGTTDYCSATDISRQLTSLYGISATPAKVVAMLKSMYGERLNSSVVTKNVTVPRKIRVYSI